MIEINLLPGAGKKKATSRSAVNLGAMATGVTGRLRDKFLIAAIAAVVIGGGAVAYLYTSQASQETELAERQEKAIADSTRYARFLADRYRSESMRDSLLRQVNIIRSLDEDRYVWSHVLDEISRALPQFTWLTTIGFTGSAQGSVNIVASPKVAEDTSAKKRNRPPKRLDTTIPKDAINVRVMGRTVDLQAVTRFMKDLEASPFFSNILLDKSEPVTDQGKEIAQFQLTFTYTRPDTTIIRRVPQPVVEVTMAIIPTVPRDRNLLLIAILALGGAAVYQQIYWTPKHQELTKLSARLDTLDSLNRVAKLDVAKGTSVKMKQEADAFARQLGVLRRLVPTENEVPALLESVSSAARRAGLELNDVQPDGVINGDQFDTYKYKLGVTGPYHQVADFLANIGSLPRIVAPINLTLATTTRTGELRPKKEEQFLDARFGIQTYVAHTTPKPDAAPAKAGAP